MTSSEIDNFQERIWQFYSSYRRDLPWRSAISEYGVFVSEVMLQQTQASRVMGHWERWLSRFPGFAELAAANLSDVLMEWQGMGYNRRAIRMRSAAQQVMRWFGGQLPHELSELIKLDGIGANTAGSVAAFAYNEPVVFIETNIRRVYINDFYSRASVTDRELLPLIEATLDRQRPREWYWALMDYGAYLGRQSVNANRRSAHYTRQPAFAGSVRQLRGLVLRELAGSRLATDEFSTHDPRLTQVLQALSLEGFIELRDGSWQIAA